MSKKYIIVNKNNPFLVWSSKYGWIDENAMSNQDPTLFDEMEITMMSLPVEGEWLEI